MPNIILIVSCGVSDLQVAVKKGNKTYQAGIDNRSLREVHDALFHGKLKYCLDTDIHQRVTRGIEVGLSQQTQLLEMVGPGSEDFRVSEADGTIRLLPAKLAPIVREIKRLRNSSVRAVIVFSTHRTTGNEPLAAGRIISKWLADEFNLKHSPDSEYVGYGYAGWVNYLDGTMRAEGEDRFDPVNRKAVQRIDDRLKDLAEEVREKDVDTPYEVMLSTGGGIPEFREQIRAAVHFRFDAAKSILDWRNPERPDDAVDTRRILPSPAQSYEARGHAGVLIHHGDFAGAVAAVRHIEDYPSEAGWTEPLKSVANYFAGLLNPAPGLPSYISNLIQDVPRCLLPAMRTESAIRSNRLPEAVLWTLTFRDAALIDFIERLPFVQGVNEEHRQLTRRADVEPPTEILNYIGDHAPLRLLRSGAYMYDTQGASRKRWVEYIDTTKKGMSLLDTRLGPQISELRNRLTHSAVSTEEMEEIVRRLIDAGLWGGDDANFKFVDQPVIRQIFVQLDKPSPKDLYEALVQGLIGNLDRHVFC